MEGGTHNERRHTLLPNDMNEFIYYKDQLAVTRSQVPAAGTKGRQLAALHS